ncbi:aspartyl aminopeptidase [Gonapodya prolifera JEL478]|uniref:aspartyl aminopeptidase n=1 Tax=Gonapodya prolifera (strain JEL478) TaxID=1344416 RepID=A0A139A924_GONPJ|nr:aspartyl aminopeptidase [Gonapodya prolifera JEL478]|eukprot:KXS13214.1 aspartyl aminopeptidase [Gonapodya prolifera JEL478]
MSSTSSTLASEFIEFVSNSPSPFHAVANAKRLLTSSGFVEIRERDSWSGKLVAGGKYFFTRNHSSILAFTLPPTFTASRPSFAIYGAHTDSPCFKLKPISKKEKVGYLQVGVQTYGGGLWNTWFDRDLGIAGRVVVEGKEGDIEHKLVDIRKPILRIPTLAIHLDRTVDSEGFKFNKELQLLPVLGAAAQSPAPAGAEVKQGADAASAYNRHHKVLVDLVASECGVAANQILDLDLCLYDIQPATRGGLDGKYVFSARLDNLCMSWCGLKALSLDSAADKASSSSAIRIVSLFDNEEVGSMSAYGADSHFLESSLRRILAGAGATAQVSLLATRTWCMLTAFEESIHRSFLISADMAHAVHPNYADKHEELHRPQINKGPVIKTNANQRYATTGVTAAVIRKLGKKVGVPVQEFVVRNDSPCGSTIGPLLSAKLGLRTVDLGNPQLSMHSIREMGGVEDLSHTVALVTEYFGSWEDIDQEVAGAAL